MRAREKTPTPCELVQSTEVVNKLSFSLAICDSPSNVACNYRSLIKRTLLWPLKRKSKRLLALQKVIAKISISPFLASTSNSAQARSCGSVKRLKWRSMSSRPVPSRLIWHSASAVYPADVSAKSTAPKAPQNNFLPERDSPGSKEGGNAVFIDVEHSQSATLKRSASISTTLWSLNPKAARTHLTSPKPSSVPSRRPNRGRLRRRLVSKRLDGQMGDTTVGLQAHDESGRVDQGCHQQVAVRCPLLTNPRK